MLRFKFQQNRTINEGFDFFDREEGGEAMGLPIINLNLDYYW